MNKQVERILQMSLLEKKDFQLLKSQTNVNQLVVKVVDRMKLLAQQNGGAILTYLDETIPEIQIDEVHFTNVIYNLFDNKKMRTYFPSLDIRAKMFSRIRWNKNQNFKENDFNDIGHITSALPYYNYFFTEKNRQLIPC